MDLYARQQFDFLFATAVERFAERLEQRNEGPARALARLREDPEGDGVWLTEFVDVVFSEFLLSDAAGAAFVLEALARRPWPQGLVGAGSIEQSLATAARAAFGELLRAKTEEALEQRALFEATGADS
mgnify:CR=1 FL=1